MMKPALPTLAFQIKSKSIPPPTEQENLEANPSLERIEIDIQQPSSQENEIPVDSKTILDKAKHLYVHSLEDLDSYIKSLTNLSLEDTETRATTLTHLKDDSNGEDSEIPKKRWVIFDMVKLGFKDDQIKEALVYLESLSNDFTKDEMLKKAIEHVVLYQRRLETVVEIEEEDRQMPSQNTPTVGERLFRLYKPPAPPKSENHSPKIAVVVQEIQEVTLSKEDLSEVSCLICYDFIPKRFLQSGKPILPCEHQFCKPCYIAYLQDKINNNKVLNIGCPFDGCSQNFEENHLTKLLTKSDIEKYKRFKKAAILSQNPNLRWCIREGCDKYAIGDDKARKIVCECGMNMCYKCGNQFHNRKSCNSIINDVYKKYAKEKNVKNCPLCRSRTEKAEGCNHITCTVCSYQWCWLCRRKYTLDHYNPENLEGCPGLQHAETKPKKKITPIDIAKKIVSFVGTVLMLPFLIVFATMYLPHWMYDKRQEKKYGPSYAQNPNNDPGLRLFLSVLGLVAFPLLFIGFIIGGLVYIFSDLFGKPKIHRVQGNNT